MRSALVVAVKTAAAVIASIEAAVKDGDTFVWLEDGKGRKIGIPADKISYIEVKVDEIFSARTIAEKVADQTGLAAESWMTSNAQLLVGLRSQSSSSIMIQTFVILAVALGIASVLAVSVVQKSKEIGILMAFGTTRAKILRIFLLQGGTVGLVGSLGGVVLGVGLAVFFAGLARNADGSSVFPVELRGALYLRASAVATITGLLAAVIPARRAAGLDPAVTIRNG